MNWLPFVKGKNKLKAIVVYPNKNVKMVNVEGDKQDFTLTENKVVRRYVIDSKAIYFFNKEPLLFYHYAHSSPIYINVDNGEGLERSMNSIEFQSIIESKAVSELLEASKGNKWDIHFIISVVTAVGVVILLLNSGGLGFLTGGG